MVEFTSVFNDKEMTFTNTGIRYDNKAFIKYEDMSEITVRKGAESALIFKYKGHLVKMPYNPADDAAISSYIDEITKEPEPEPIPEILPTDKFNYLDAKEEPEETVVEEEAKKSNKKGILIGLIAGAAIVVLALIILL